MNISYEELTNESNDAETVDPFWALEDRTDLSVLKWLKEACASSLPFTQARANNQLTNLSLCKGIHWEAQDAFADFRTSDRFRYESDTTKVVVNDIQRYVETTSAKLTRFTPAVLINPDTNEYPDKQGAKAAQRAIESHDQAIDAQRIIRETARHAMIYGYQPILVMWNPDKGPISERWRKAKDAYGDEAMQFKRAKHGYSAGDKYFPEKPEFLGEVDVRLPQPWELTFAPAACPAECEWVIYQTTEHIEKIRRDHPKKKGQIDASKFKDGEVCLDVDTLQVSRRKNHVKVTYFWHRSSKYLPGGRYIKAIPGLILENKANPLAGAEILQESQWGDLPIEWMTDVTFNGHFFGMSSLNFIKNLSHMRNQFLTMANRSALLFGHPKILAHRRARVSVSDFGNDATFVEWDGMIEPKLATFATVPGDIMKLYEMIGGEQDKLMKIHPISSGEPPAGIKAGVALRLLEQVEDMLMTNLVKTHERFITDFARKRLAIMGLNYKKDDGRMIRILGADNRDVVEALDIEALSKRYNLRVEHASAFSRNPAARAQQVIDLLEVKPDSMSNEQVIDALELTRPEKITDPAQAAVSAAEYINELCSQDRELPKPRQGEHFLVRWPIHMAFYQRAGFADLPERAQERFVDYMLALEFLMSEQANINPAFAQRVFSMPNFPAFYNLPPQQIAAIHGVQDGAMGPGQPKPQPALPQQLEPPGQQFQPSGPLTNEQIAQGA